MRNSIISLLLLFSPPAQAGVIFFTPQEWKAIPGPYEELVPAPHANGHAMDLGSGRYADFGFQFERPFLYPWLLAEYTQFQVKSSTYKFGFYVTAFTGSDEYPGKNKQIEITFEGSKYIFPSIDGGYQFVGWRAKAGTPVSIKLTNRSDAGTLLHISPAVFVGGGVPEPAAWMMMVAGFGLIGAAFRLRCRKENLGIIPRQIAVSDTDGSAPGWL